MKLDKNSKEQIKQEIEIINGILSVVTVNLPWSVEECKHASTEIYRKIRHDLRLVDDDKKE